MKPSSPHKEHVVLHLPRGAIAILSMAKAILAALTLAKVTFPTPNPTLAQLSSDIDALDAAQTATLARNVGAVQKRDVALAVVVTDLDHICAYVQQVADADPPNALTIARSAALDVRKKTAPSKNDLNVKPGKVSGTLAVSARVAGVKSSHEWQYSTDGGKTWMAAPSSLQAKTIITGLVPATTVLVRHQAVTKAGPQNWSQPISVIVH